MLEPVLKGRLLFNEVKDVIVVFHLINHTSGPLLPSLSFRFFFPPLLLLCWYKVWIHFLNFIRHIINPTIPF
jgi:hypothetical protein